VRIARENGWIRRRSARTKGETMKSMCATHADMEMARVIIINSHENKPNVNFFRGKICRNNTAHRKFETRYVAQEIAFV